MKAMEKCPFCKIAGGELACEKVYEDDLVIAFLDIAPLTKGHTLVIPREHHHSVTTLPTPLAARLMQTAANIGAALMRTVDGDGFNLLVANGPCAGQTVPHAHVHVLPRRPDDGLVLPARTVHYDDADEKAAILEETRRRLES